MVRVPTATRQLGVRHLPLPPPLSPPPSQPRKRVDERVRTLIDNGVKSRTRSFFVVVGDRGRDQVATLHYLLSKAQVKARPNVLWCYHRELGFSAHRSKRIKQVKKLQARGVYEADKENPFELFISSTSIRWCYYKETQRILGNTYGMVVLQDFEAITPNILCRTMETVEGGGIVVLLLHTMSSLKQLYTLAMDVHARFRTDAHADVVGRFNERFILSLAECAACLVLDDELNVLPISRHAKALAPIEAEASGAGAGAGAAAGGDDDEGESRAVVPVASAAARELRELQTSLATTKLVGSLVQLARTLDQAKALLSFAEAISEKTLRSTVALTAGRGRGKSAALGLAIAAAVGMGYANIFVTSPSPENLTTLFEFVFKGLEALAYKEHTDYEAIASTNPDYNKAVVRVNIFRGHRQTVQYIEPHDADKLAQAELVVIDEAAAIPLPLVKRLLGPYLVFLASTVNGYEGTGRSLSLKLIQQLRQQQAAASSAASAAMWSTAAAGGAGAGAGAGTAAAAALAPTSLSSLGGRTLREVLLSEPIRYASGDPVEAWLNDLLCLDATTPYRLAHRLPAPTECELYAVDRDTLFSYHKVTESFLHRMMSLYVSSHYKNTPNDLQMMSDAPAHKLFVLLGPHPSAAAGGSGGEALPDILVVVQVCMEGKISADSLKASLARGSRSAGDLIPWTLAQQYQDDGFAMLSGARIVRIATHPDATKMGYGTRAIELLKAYFAGQMVLLDADAVEEAPDLQVDRGVGRAITAAAGGAGASAAAASDLLSEKVKPRKELPPLLVNVADIQRPPRLHWLGVSYGLTLPLFNFWRRCGMLPAYLRQTANDLTAEHSLIMLAPLDTADLPPSAAPRAGWHLGYIADFARRYMSLLSYEFRSFDVTLALSVMDSACSVYGGGSSGSGSGSGGGASEASGGAEGDADDDEAGAGAGSARMLAPASTLGSRALTTPLTYDDLLVVMTPHDLKRLEAYARNAVDFHLVLDLMPEVARLWFMGRLPTVALPRLQAGILLAIGLQHVTVEAVAAHFDIAVSQVLALFNKAIRKISLTLTRLQEEAVARTVVGGGGDKRAASSGAASGGAGLAGLSAASLAAFAVPTSVASAAPSTVAGVKRRHADASGGSSGAGGRDGRGGERHRGGGGGGADAAGSGEVYDPHGRLSQGGGKGVKRARSAREGR